MSYSPSPLNKEQLITLAKLKGLATVLSNSVTVIEETENPAEIEEAIRAIEYYQRHYFNQVLIAQA